jgi:N-acetylglucosamine-6-phosphate deacetylase
LICVARHFASGQWIRVTTEGQAIAAVEPADGPESISPEDDWVAPAFWDIQVNGRLGVSFSSPDLTEEQVAEVALAQRTEGVARFCPTLITAPQAAMLHGVRTIARSCDRFPEVAAMVLGIHLEGPAISELDGYRGAHPLEAVRNPDWSEFEELQEASGARIRLVTLAPEREGALEFIARAAAMGVRIALGHTAADPETIRAAVAAGASLSTHLGNGIAASLPRHPNPIWTQAADDRLMASLIADGHHLPTEVLRVLVRAKTPERVVLVSDASPLAGLGPGVYGAWEVTADGKVVVAGTPYLAGSSRGIGFGVATLIREAGLTVPQALATASINPARLLGLPEPGLAVGQPANLIRFQAQPSFRVDVTCVDGTWIAAS